MKKSTKINNLIVKHTEDLNEGSQIRNRAKYKNSKNMGKGEVFTKQEKMEMEKFAKEMGFKTMKYEYMEEGNRGSIRYEELTLGRGDIIWVTKEVHYDTSKQIGPGYGDFEPIPEKDVKPGKFVRGPHTGHDAIFYYISTNRTGRYANKLTTDDDDVWEGDFIEVFKDAVKSWVEEHFNKPPQ